MFTLRAAMRLVLLLKSFEMKEKEKANYIRKVAIVECIAVGIIRRITSFSLFEHSIFFLVKF